jgi:hypothetical protein
MLYLRLDALDPDPVILIVSAPELGKPLFVSLRDIFASITGFPV